MMKIKKSLLSVCLSISLMFGCLVPSISAQASSGDQNQSVFDRFSEKFYQIANKTTGVILSPIAGAKDSFIQWLGSNKENYGGTSSQSTSDFVNQNFSYDTSNYTIGENLINSMRDFNQYYISNDSDMFYVYSYDIQSLISRIDIDSYNDFISIMADYPNDYFTLSISGSTVYLNHWEGVTDLVYYSLNSTYYQYQVYFYSEGSRVIPKVTTYHRNYSSDVPISEVLTNYTPSVKIFGSYEDPVLSNSMDNIVVDIGSYQYVCYKTSSNLPSENTGVQDYYISDSYNTLHVDNSMVLSISEVDNSVTYNDVNTYIDTFRDTNNRVPTSNEIYIYINNFDGNGTDEPTPSPTPTPPPDGGDDDNGPDWDFGFLNTIAEFVSALISAIGEVVSGIVSAITDFVNVLKDGIPNIIGSLISYFLPFLPEEIITMVSLAIVLAVLLFVIRTIRGS